MEARKVTGANMDANYEEAVKIALEKHPKKSDKPIQYGTAGFRSKACDLDHVLYRMGLLAVIRSQSKKGATIGCVITASHNPEEDNGVKLVDPMGEMLEMDWESHASYLANISDQELGQALKSIAEKTQTNTSNQANVVFARDTRPSSITLSRSLQDGIQVLGGKFNDYGLLTTPQLHYMVRCINTGGQYGKPTEENYYTKLTAAFNKLRGKDSTRGNYKPHLIIDGSNGVGAVKLKHLLPYTKNSLTVKVKNDGSQGKVNYMCGADYVKSQQKAAEGVSLSAGDRCASFDGDADRIVYYLVDQAGKFHLLDGDKIATLIAGYLQELLAATGLQLDLGLVQTAYANGSSTNYITKQLKVPVACVPTGVKHLHKKAGEFDIGIYFEANGHGTVLFSEMASHRINTAACDKNIQPDQKEAAARLRAVIDVINQTAGDAISDMLLVEAILHVRGWSAEDWDAVYTDLPNRLLKVKVKDRTVIKTTDAERQVSAPAGLQDAINELVTKYKNGRSFVRPSGTEDVVRVYSEADTRANADQLAYEVGMKVYEIAGGLEKPPKPQL